MGLFDFFRKIIEPEKNEPKIEQESIAFSDIGNWIERKRTEVKIEEEKIFHLIQEKVRVFAQEIREKIKVIEGFDVESKKAGDRINFMVNEGRRKYIESLEDFIGKLEILEKEKLVENINKIFLDFNKNSYRDYERTTILIGKEMADIKNVLRTFSKDFTSIFDENKNISNLSKTVFLIEFKLNRVSEDDVILREINETIIFLDKKICDKKEENSEILREIEKIKKSENYIKNLEMREKVRLLEGELEKDLLTLKQSIDFKALTNFFHIFEGQMGIVKSYREDFQTRFKEDNGEDLVHLLNESKLNNEIILEKIRQINNKTEAIIKNREDTKKDYTEKLYSKLASIILDIGNLNNDKVREEKRNVKVKASREEDIMEIKGGLSREGVIIDSKSII